MSAADFIAPDLKLEDVMPAARQHFLRFGDVPRGIAASQGPRHRQSIANTAAHELRHRQSRTLAKGVEQRRLDCAFGEVIIARGLADRRHQRINSIRIPLQQMRGEVGIDRQLHALGAFGPIGQPPDRGAFAESDDTVRRYRFEQASGSARS